MNGIIKAIATPFNPFWGYSQLDKNGKISLQYLIAFLFILVVGVTAFHLLSPFVYRTSNILIINRLGFLIGLGVRIIIVAYTLSLVVSKATNIKFTFKHTFPIVTLAASTLLYPFFFYWINPKSYVVADSLSILWFCLIITIGIWKKTNLNFLKSLALTLIAVTLYWLITVTFIPYGMKI